MSADILKMQAPRRIWLVTGWLGVVGVIVLSLVFQHPDRLGRVDYTDKFEHIAAYGLLMWWFAQDVLTARQRAGVAFAIFALGVALEFVQDLGGSRSLSVTDMVANSIGIAAGWALAPPRLPNVLQWLTATLRR